MTARRNGGARQRRQQVHHASLAIPLPVAPTAAECGALLKALIKHLLFQRAQIPYLYDELLRPAQEQQRAAAEAAQQAGGGRRPRRRRVPSADRRLLKFLTKAEELMAAIDAALASFGVPRRAFLLLGSSTSRPREAYEVLLPAAAVGPRPLLPESAAAADAAAGGAAQPAPLQQQQPTGNTGMSELMQAQPGGRPKPSRQERLCLLAVRQLIVAGADLPEGTAHRVPCKLFLLLEGASIGGGSSAGHGFGAGAAAGCSEVQPALPSAPPGFAVKRQFRLAMRKGMHLKLLLGQQPELKPAAVPEEPTAQPEPVQCEEQEGAETGDSSSDMEMGSSCSEQEGVEGGSSTKHLSQLPDAAASQQPPSLALATTPAADTAGSTWYLCKTALKGLNSGSQDDGAAAEGF